MPGDSHAKPDAGESVRAFVAIAVPDAARTELSRAARESKEMAGPIRWVRAENLHLTLRFLGDVERPLLPGLLTALEEAASVCVRFSLRLRELAWFPSSSRPRVVAACVDESPELRALVRAVEAGLAATGFSPEERPFRAHITLGRVKGRLRGAPAIDRPLSGVIDVDRVVLVQSRLDPGGAIYTELGAIALAGR